MQTMPRCKGEKFFCYFIVVVGVIDCFGTMMNRKEVPQVLPSKVVPGQNGRRFIREMLLSFVCRGNVFIGEMLCEPAVDKGRPTSQSD
jgi:hypothetical protein